MPILTFLGLAPEEGVTAQEQREHFSIRLADQLRMGRVVADDWDNLLMHLGRQTSSGPILIVLDEINWMGSKDHTFLPKLKTAWDLYFSKNPEFISTGFFGRITLDMTLEDLPLAHCAKFWGPQGETLSAYEKFKVLSVTGGVPRYLELIRPKETAEENIKRLCFTRDGELLNEFDRIFSDLFSRRQAAYKYLIERLVEGPATVEQIGKRHGLATEYLEDLVQTRYLDRDHT